jgi:hypothetical protein
MIVLGWLRRREVSRCREGAELGALDKTMYAFLFGSERNLPLLQVVSRLLPRSLELSQLTVCPGRRRYRSTIIVIFTIASDSLKSHLETPRSITNSSSCLSSSSGCLNTFRHAFKRVLEPFRPNLASSRLPRSHPSTILIQIFTFNGVLFVRARVALGIRRVADANPLYLGEIPYEPHQLPRRERDHEALQLLPRHNYPASSTAPAGNFHAGARTAWVEVVETRREVELEDVVQVRVKPRAPARAKQLDAVADFDGFVDIYLPCLKSTRQSTKQNFFLVGLLFFISYFLFFYFCFAGLCRHVYRLGLSKQTRNKPSAFEPRFHVPITSFRCRSPVNTTVLVTSSRVMMQALRKRPAERGT